MTTESLNIEKINRDNFRSCMGALARPGQPYAVTPLFDSALLAVAATVLYPEVSYCYRGTLEFGLVAALCATHSADAGEADYLFSDSWDRVLLAAAKCGTAESPEFSATLIAGYRREHAPSTPVKLTGPGIEERADCLLPLAHEDIVALLEKNERFPTGVDLFLVGDDHTLLGLPRTVHIEVAS